MDMLNWLKEIKMNKLSLPLICKVSANELQVSVKDMLCDADIMAKCVASAVERYNTPLALMPFDSTIEAELFGCEVLFSNCEMPTISNMPFSMRVEHPLSNLRMPKIGVGRSGIVFEAIKKVKETIVEKPLFAYCLGPFTLAAKLFSLEDILFICDEDPDLMDELMEKLTFFITEYILHLKSAGADGVFIDESAAGNIHPSLNAEYSAPFMTKIVAETQNKNFIAIHHTAGEKVSRQIGNILDTECKIYHFGEGTDLADISNFIPDETIFMGNVSGDCFINDNIECLENAVADLIKCCGGRENFIPSTCDIPYNANPNCVEKFISLTKNFYEGK